MSPTSIARAGATAPVHTLQLVRALAHLRWAEVESSAVAAVAYDASTQTLYVELKGGAARIYAYLGMQSDAFVAFMTAPSQGSFYARNIRNAYPCERIEFAVAEVEAR